MYVRYICESKTSLNVYVRIVEPMAATGPKEPTFSTGTTFTYYPWFAQKVSAVSRQEWRHLSPALRFEENSLTKTKDF